MQAANRYCVVSAARLQAARRKKDGDTFASHRCRHRKESSDRRAGLDPGPA